MTAQYPRKFRYSIDVLNIALLVFTLFLSACGGGSSTAEADSVTINSITYSPSAPQSGNPVSVTADVSAYIGSSSGGTVTYLWTQNSGPAVSLSGTTSSTVYFTAPTVSASTNVVLALTTTLNAVSASKSVTITIAP